MSITDLINQISQLPNPSPNTIRSLIADAELTVTTDDVDAEMARMRDAVDETTVDAITAVRALRDAVATDATATDPEPEPDPEPPAAENNPEPDPEPEPETNHQEDQAVTDQKPIEGELVGAGASGAEFSRREVDTTHVRLRRGVNIRRKSSPNSFYQAFSGGTRIESPDQVGPRVTQTMDLTKLSGTAPEGIPVIEFKAKPEAEWGIVRREAHMGDQAVLDLLDRAVDQHTQRLNNPDSAEFANTGWCSPSVDRYEFCPVPSALGLFADAIPMILTERGGTRWPVMPPIGDLWGNGFLCQTEEEVMVREDDKPCVELPCVDWEDFRNRVCSFCLTSSILTNRAFPELIANFVAIYTMLYEHWLSWQMLQQAIAYADAMNGALRWSTAGWGITLALKEKIEFAISSIAADEMLSTEEADSMIWNVAVPQWAFGAIKADLSKRVGGGLDMMRVSDSEIRTILSGGRDVRIHPLQVWQSSVVAPPDAEMTQWIGSDESIAAGVYPETMEVLVWPQGTFVGVRDDFLNLRSRLEYPLLRQNKMLQVFTESEWNLIPRCYQAIHFTLDICTAGRTSAPVNFPCNPNTEDVTLIGSVPMAGGGDEPAEEPAALTAA